MVKMVHVIPTFWICISRNSTRGKPSSWMLLIVSKIVITWTVQWIKVVWERVTEWVSVKKLWIYLRKRKLNSHSLKILITRILMPLRIDSHSSHYHNHKTLESNLYWIIAFLCLIASLILGTTWRELNIKYYWPLCTTEWYFYIITQVLHKFKLMTWMYHQHSRIMEIFRSTIPSLTWRKI